MTEHEKLRVVCDKIEFWEYDWPTFRIKYDLNIIYNRDVNEFLKLYWTQYRKVDLRIIIFTAKFIEHLNKYLLIHKKGLFSNLYKIWEMYCWFFTEKNLKDPVWYLHNLIK